MKTIDIGGCGHWMIHGVIIRVRSVRSMRSAAADDNPGPGADVKRMTNTALMWARRHANRQNCNFADRFL